MVIGSCIPLEKMTYCLRNKSETFYRIWQLFIDYMDNLPSHCHVIFHTSKLHDNVRGDYPYNMQPTASGHLIQWLIFIF